MSKQYTEMEPYTTAGAVANSISVLGDFDIVRIDIAVDIAPTTAGSLTITKNSAAGAAYDTLIQSINMVGVTSYVIGDAAGLKGLKSGDAIDIAYTNADTRTITITATVVQ